MFSPSRLMTIAEVMGVTAKAMSVMVQDSTRYLPMTRTKSLVPSVFDNFTIGAIRHHICDMFNAKQMFTIGYLMADLKTASIISETTSVTSMWRLIHNMGLLQKFT